MAPAHPSVYDTLIYTVLQKPREAEGRGMVIALTSAASGEGVTFVTNGVVNELAASEINSIAQIRGTALRNLGTAAIENAHNALPRSRGKICNFASIEPSLLINEGARRWDGSWLYRRDCIDLFRREFDYTFVDCPSLKESGSVLSIAPFVDGVILVVEANRTRREQIRHAEKTIEGAQGKILGHILNKRIYEIPGWIYRRL